MPKGISREENKLLERFKVVVQQRMDFTVTLHKNYALLSELVYKRTNCKISTSTVKRIFSQTNQTVPSKYSLDCIARAIGYEGWDDFVKKDLEFSDFEHHEIIHNLKYVSFKDTDEFYSIFYHFLETPNCYKITVALIEAANRTNNVEVLSKIFDLPKVLDLNQKNHPGICFHEEVGMIFRNSLVIRELAPIYAKHPVAQTSYIEIEVDEEMLNGYYGVMLEEYAKYKTNAEAQLFYHCLMCQRDFENGDFNSVHFNYLIHFRTAEKIHPTPLIRRLALIIIKNIDNLELVDSLIDEIPNLLKGSDEVITHFNIYKFCNLVFQCRNPYPIKRALTFLPLPTNDLKYHHGTNRLLNMLKIYESFVLVKNGQHKEAKERLQAYNKLYCFPNILVKTKIHFDIVNRLIEVNK